MVHLEEIQQLVAVGRATNYHIYKCLCEVVPYNWVIDDKYELVVEIDSEENRELVDNLQKLFFVKVLKRVTADTKVRNQNFIQKLGQKLVHKIDDI